MDIYKSRIEEQIKQFSDGAPIHDLPPIFHYWSQKFLLPRMKEVLEVESSTEFYAKAFFDVLVFPDIPRRLISIGSGDASQEIDVVKRLLDLGGRDFVLECFEISPELVKRADEAVAINGLSNYIKLHICDINEWSIQGSFIGIMAHHSLHHFVQLERIFDGIKSCLDYRGVFVTNDVIGRNGHMRWPETLTLINSIWAFQHIGKKYNHQMREFHETFMNYDCSSVGFEGIRAQDILPALEKRFYFKRFLAFGNLTDIFIDRGYGLNYSENDIKDCAFIDFLDLLNNIMIDHGILKPTIMFAELTVQPRSTRIYRHWTPQFCMRLP